MPTLQKELEEFKARLLGPVVLEVVNGVAVDVLHQVLRHHLLEEVPLVAFG